MPHIPELLKEPHVSYEWCSFVKHLYESCHIYMSHVTYIRVMPHIYESCHMYMRHVIYGCVMSHIYESCHMYMSHVCHVSHTNDVVLRMDFDIAEDEVSMNHVAHMYESCHTWMSRVVHTYGSCVIGEWCGFTHGYCKRNAWGLDESCCTCVWFMLHMCMRHVAHMYACIMLHIYTSHAAHMYDLCCTCVRFMLRICMSHVVHVYELCCTCV